MPSPTRNSRGSLPTRATLLARLKDAEDRASWQEFYNLYSKRVYRFAVQRGMTPEEAEDVVQETFLCVSRKIPEFHYDSSRGKFRSWLLHLAQWRIGDEFRKRQRQPLTFASADPAGQTSLLENLPNPASEADLEAVIEREWREALLDAALRRVKRRVNAKQFQAYDLCAVKGWPAAKAAVALGISTARVHLAKHRVSRLVRQEVHKLDKDRT